MWRVLLTSLFMTGHNCIHCIPKAIPIDRYLFLSLRPWRWQDSSCKSQALAICSIECLYLREPHSNIWMQNSYPAVPLHISHIWAQGIIITIENSWYIWSYATYLSIVKLSTAWFANLQTSYGVFFASWRPRIWMEFSSKSVVFPQNLSPPPAAPPKKPNATLGIIWDLGFDYHHLSNPCMNTNRIFIYIYIYT